MDKIVEKTSAELKSTFEITREMSEKIFVIPPSRTRYLSEISENNRKYDQTVLTQVEVALKLYGIYKTICSVAGISLDQEKSIIDKSGIVTPLPKFQTLEEVNKTFIVL